VGTSSTKSASDRLRFWSRTVFIVGGVLLLFTVVLSIALPGVTLVSVIGGLAFTTCFAGFYLHIQSRQTTQSDPVTGSLAEGEARHSKESGTD
jgi:F0F1-type ATP synthase assembly protein I